VPVVKEDFAGQMDAVTVDRMNSSLDASHSHKMGYGVANRESKGVQNFANIGELSDVGDMSRAGETVEENEKVMHATLEQKANDAGESLTNITVQNLQMASAENR